MQYLDDIYELIEDLPQEVNKRSEQIGVWDKQANEYTAESRTLQKQLDTSSHLGDEQKAILFAQITEKMRLARELIQRKVDLSARTERLLLAIYEKCSEYAFNCKLELEVDSAGSTKMIEDAWVRSMLLYEQCGRGGRSMSPERPCSSSVSRETTPFLAAALARPSNTVASKGKAIRDKNDVAEKKQKKKNNQAPGGIVLSAYMRKKKEKLREQKKLMEVHAQREKEKILLQKMKEEPLDLVSFCAHGGGGRGSCTGASPSPAADPLLSDDADDLMDIFPDIPSHAMDMLECLGGEENFDMSLLHNPMGYGGQEEDGRTPSPAGAVSSSSRSSNNEKKRRMLSFGGGGESMHGRQRKLTNRAEELVSEMRRDREKRRAGEEEDDDTPYCYCRQPSSGNMIQCENPECPYGWFHFVCLQLTATPPGNWFCRDCKR